MNSKNMEDYLDDGHAEILLDITIRNKRSLKEMFRKNHFNYDKLKRELVELFEKKVRCNDRLIETLNKTLDERKHIVAELIKSAD